MALNFDNVAKIIQDGQLGGPTQAICNGINALATGAVRVIKTGTTEDLKGIVGEATDTDGNKEGVLFSNIEDKAALLLVVAMASLMGIQLHNNLKTQNPTLWQELKALTESRFFKTIITSPAEVQKRVIQSITEGLLDGPPCILTDTGDLYISGDILEMVFQSLQNAGAFATGEVRYDVVEMPTAIDDLDGGGYIIGTWAEFMEYMDSQWSTIKAFNNAHTGRNYSERGYSDYREFINAAGSFTEYWANMKALFSNNSTAMEYMTRAETGTGLIYGYEVGACKDNQQSDWPYGHLLIYAVYKNFSRFLVSEYTAATPPYVTMGTDRREMIAYSEVFGFCKGYSWDGWGWRTSNVCYSNIRSIGGYSWIDIYDTYGQPAQSALGQNTYSTGAWFIYTGKSSGGDTPPGLNQEEGAKLPTSDTASIGAWITANLADYDTTKLTTDAPGTFNIAAHKQAWYKLTVPYSLGYNTELDGTTEEPEGGAITQTTTTTTSQEDENEAAGVEDTGTGTSTIINYYESKEGSEKETEGQEDNGEIEEEQLPQKSWNAAGATGIYCPTDAEMGQISNWLWSTDFTDVIAQFFQDPAEALISLQRCWLPFTTSGGQEVVFGRVGSGISVATANKYHQHSCGSVYVPKFYNNYLDFEAQASIYIPFAGFQSLDIRDIIEAELTLKYKFDIATGQGVAELWVSRDKMSAPLYQYQINCNEQIPCSSSNQAQFMMGVANMLTSTAIGTVGGFMAGGPVGGVIGGGVAAAAGIAGMQGSQHVAQGGTISGNAAAVACKTPFITIRYPKDNTPVGFNEFLGIGIDTVGTLGSFQGYVRCQEVHLEGGAGASQAEMDAIEAILKEGVIL